MPANPVEEKPSPREPQHTDGRSWRERFRHWRATRPFAGGLLMLLSGIIMVAPAYFTVQISDLLVMISTISGVSTLLIGALMIMFGIGSWLQPYAATYLGVLGIIVAIVAVPTSNFGGFLIGSLLGIIGGALALGWEREPRHPGKHRQAAPVFAVVASVSLVGLILDADPKVSAQESPTPPPGNPAIIRGDHVALTGNVHATVGMSTLGGSQERTLILTGDELVARNLSLDLPGLPGRGNLTTGPVETKLSRGPVRIEVTGITATPVVAGVSTLPVTVDLKGELGTILKQLGIPDARPVPNAAVPDMVMDHIALNNATLELVSLHSQRFHAPAVSLTAINT